jgi:hypothetical protein
MLDPALLKHATFAAHVNSTFKVVNNNAVVTELQLVEVSEFKESPRNESFSILFRGPAGSPLPQGRYEFDHNAIGSFPLFIVPVAKDDQGLVYEAVFNRIREQGKSV